MKKYILFLILCMIILFSFPLVSSGVPAAGDLWTGFLSDYFKQILHFDVSNVVYNEPPTLDWYPVEPWEVQYCSKDMSSEFFLDNQKQSLNINVDGKVYSLTIALNPEIMQTFFTDDAGKSQQLFTIGWYIQGTSSSGSNNAKVKYDIKLYPGNTKLDLGSGEKEKEFSLVTGTSGFYSNYTIQCPEKVILTIRGDKNKICPLMDHT